MSEETTQVLRRQSSPARVGGSPPAAGTDTVTVACKLPMGVHMVLYDVIVEKLRDLGGNEQESFRSYPRTGAPTFILNGCSVDIEKMRKGELPDYTIVQGSLPGTGFGLTSGIPRDFWEEWTRAPEFADGKVVTHPGPGYDLVKTGQVFAAANDQRAAAEAKEKRDVRSGLEPLNPADPGPRAGLPTGSIRQSTKGAAQTPDI
jgi:hypothetical protein